MSNRKGQFFDLEPSSCSFSSACGQSPNPQPYTHTMEKPERMKGNTRGLGLRAQPRVAAAAFELAFGTTTHPSQAYAMLSPARLSGV